VSALEGLPKAQPDRRSAGHEHASSSSAGYLSVAWVIAATWASAPGLVAPGFLADTAVVQRAAVHPLPPGVDLADGALTEPLAVAWHASAKAGLSAGEIAVVFGGGPIGIGTALSTHAPGYIFVTDVPDHTYAV
jgi:threonine dehydrogenase-like Zn-dependent dehydrogenase